MLLLVNMLLWFLVYQLVFICECWLLFDLLNDVTISLFLNFIANRVFVCVSCYLVRVCS